MAGEEKLKKELKELKDTLKVIVSSLRSIAECPICLGTIKVPFRMCSTGHGVCSSCCEQLQLCPTCRSPFTTENPVCLKNLIEALPRECKYAESGCEDYVTEQDDHELFCGYRPITCCHYCCEVELPLIKLVDHYESEHPGGLLYGQTQCTWWKEEHHHVPVFAFENIFWFSQFNEGKITKFSFQATPIGKLNKNYFARVEFKKGIFTNVFTIKAAVFEEYKKDEECYMILHDKVLSRFIDDSENLIYKVYFYEEI